MKEFKVPTKNEVSENNQTIFNELEKGLGFVPNLYAYYAKSETALGDYLTFQNRKTSLSKKEKEVINLAVSQHNGCEYCTAAHTLIGGLNGLTKEQILDIRSNTIGFDTKLKALTNFVFAVVRNNGKVSDQEKNDFFEAGYTEENLIDIVLNIGDKVVSNFIHNITQFEIDFPKAPALESQTIA